MGVNTFEGLRVWQAADVEARALLHAAYGRQYLPRTDYERLVEMTQSVGRMLRVLESTLRSLPAKIAETLSPSEISVEGGEVSGR